MSLYPFVQLKRASNSASFEGAFLNCEIEVTDALVPILDNCTQDIREVNGNIIDEDNINFIGHVGQTVYIKFRLPRKNATQFYQNWDTFLGGFSKSFSSFTENLPEFYLFEDDQYYSPISEESDSNDLFTRLSTLIKNISKLEKIAHYHDKKSGVDRTLVYLAGEQKNPVVLLVHLSKDLLQGDINFSLLDELTAENCELSTHYSEKINIFYASLHEFLTGCSTPNEAFLKLITNWGSFTQLFRNNIQTYLSGFSFKKAKKEIVEAELELSEKLTNLTSDIVFKLFSVPASIIALAAILQRGTLDVFVITLLLVGVVVTVVLMYGLLVSQQNKYESLVKAKDLVFSSIGGNEVDYPAELHDEISKMKIRLDSHFTSTNKWLRKFKFAIFTPLLAIALFIIWA